MALSDIQERVERSIYEAIRLMLVELEYLPDIDDDILFPKNNSNLDTEGQANWDAKLAEIKNAQKFAAEVFNSSGHQDKGLERVPRIVIITRRVMAGDIGLPLGSVIVQKPLDPDNLTKYKNPPESADLSIDLNLVSNTTQQSRFLNALIAKTIGAKKYLPFYDNPRESFLMRQTNFYDLPDPQDGLKEDIYSYEIKDLYFYDIGENAGQAVSRIKEITVETNIAEYANILSAQGTIIGPYVQDGNIYIDLSGVTYN